MKLELLENEDDLEYEDERLIANRTQRIGLLITKKTCSVRIVNEVCEILYEDSERRWRLRKLLPSGQYM